VIDHIVIGRPNFCSLRALGYFASFLATPADIGWGFF
jgi:hypothetical protein